MFIPNPHDEKRIKMNFMVKNSVVKMLQHWVLAGKRSDFVNDVLEYALKKAAQKEAMEFMDKVRKEGKFRMTTKEIREAREYGRE